MQKYTAAITVPENDQKFSADVNTSTEAGTARHRMPTAGTPEPVGGTNGPFHRSRPHRVATGGLNTPPKYISSETQRVEQCDGHPDVDDDTCVVARRLHRVDDGSRIAEKPSRSGAATIAESAGP